MKVRCLCRKTSWSCLSWTLVVDDVNLVAQDRLDSREVSLGKSCSHLRVLVIESVNGEQPCSHRNRKFVMSLGQLCLQLRNLCYLVSSFSSPSYPNRLLAFLPPSSRGLLDRVLDCSVILRSCCKIWALVSKFECYCSTKCCINSQIMLLIWRWLPSWVY